MTDPGTLEATVREPGGAPDIGQLAAARLRISQTRIDGDGPRFEPGELLGQGANGRVWLAHDRTLGRAVAVKAIDPSAQGDERQRGRFLREARVTAGLEHAGVVPVHDIGVADDGAMYLSMRRVVGDTLAAVNERRRRGEDPHGLGSPNQIVNLFLKIAYTLAHAHERGVVHRDIKPENIMLGSFGEVFLVDWGSASDGMDDTGRIARVVGTPLFMSPEQARTEPATVASDIYCLGGTLFETLVGRAPLDVKRGGDFWERKRHGEIDLPTRSERYGVPKRLLAIALKSLAAEPAGRYIGAVAFARDLEAYQAGQALTAYRESVVERLVRWWCRHWRTVVVAGLVLGAIGGASWIVASERLKEWATWGSLAVVETFDEDSSWGRRWQVVTGGAVVQDGVLVTTSPAAFISYFKERMYGPVAIEFTGRIRPGAVPCDLSAVWCENITDFAGASTGSPVYTLKVGGNDNSKATISLNQGERNERFLAQRAHSLEPGRAYRVRAEIDGSHLRVLLDGELAIETWLDVPLPAGHIGLYGYYSGKTFDDVRIYRKDVPERVSPLAIGDAFFQTRQWDLAAMHYGRVIDSHPNAEMAVIARYRRGLCHLRADRWAEAQAGAGVVGTVSRWRGTRSGRGASTASSPRRQTHRPSGLARRTDLPAHVESAACAPCDHWPVAGRLCAQWRRIHCRQLPQTTSRPIPRRPYGAHDCGR